MLSESNKFIDYIIKSILANNEFSITVVNDIKTLASRYFIKNEYPDIVHLIKSEDTDAIISLQDNKVEDIKFPKEYLDILLFSDQNNNKYIVTVYDSDELFQDPQVIEIFKCGTVSTTN